MDLLFGIFPPGQNNFQLFWSPSTMGANQNKDKQLLVIQRPLINRVLTVQVWMSLAQVAGALKNVLAIAAGIVEAGVRARGGEPWIGFEFLRDGHVIS